MSSQRQDLRLVYRGGANLYITSMCNGRCPYCCLKEWITDDAQDAQYMSLEDLDRVIKWLKESEITFVQLIGGEPLLHPDILEIVRRLKASGVGIRTILTNGLGDTEVYRGIQGIVDTIWLVNINHPDTYTQEEWETITRNLDLLKWKGEDKLILDEPFDLQSLSLQLAVNMYRPGFDYGYIIELAKKYRVSHIRYAPPHPSAERTNAHVAFDEMSEIKPTIMSFIRDAVSAGIKPGLECVLPPCVFTTSEWRYLILFTEALKAVCQPDLEVLPDLSVHTCVSMMGLVPSYKVGEMNAQEMIKGFIGGTQKYREAVLPQCENCVIFKTKGCQGYCLRFKADHVKTGWRSIFKRR